MSSSLKKKSVSLQGWITLVTLITTIAFGYFLFFKKPDISKRSSASLLPTITCPDGSKGGKLSNSYSPGPEFRIRYTSKATDCNSTPGDIANQLGGQLSTYRRSFVSFGIQPPPEPISVALLNSPRKGDLQVFAVAGRPGAFILDSQTSRSLLGPQGYTELSLLENVPGLSEQATQRVALAITALASKTKEVPQEISSSLKNGNGYRGDEGLYDAWLVARYGKDVLKRALDKCRLTCNYSQALRSSLRVEGKDPVQLERLFSARAASPATRFALLERIRAN